MFKSTTGDFHSNSLTGEKNVCTPIHGRSAICQVSSASSSFVHLIFFLCIIILFKLIHQDSQLTFLDKWRGFVSKKVNIFFWWLTKCVFFYKSQHLRIKSSPTWACQLVSSLLPFFSRPHLSLGFNNSFPASHYCNKHLYYYYMNACLTWIYKSLKLSYFYDCHKREMRCKTLCSTFISRDPLQKNLQKKMIKIKMFGMTLLLGRVPGTTNYSFEMRGKVWNKQVTTLNANSLSKSRRDATLRDVDKLSSTTTDTLPNFFSGKEKTDPDVQTCFFYGL